MSARVRSETMSTCEGTLQKRNREQRGRESSHSEGVPTRVGEGIKGGKIGPGRRGEVRVG